jgi:hypothetical protein
VLGCIWTSSQPIRTIATSYMKGISKIISQHSPDLQELT